MISKKKVNESDYDEYLMFIFWSISIPIYLFCFLLAIIFRHIFPLLIFL